jgi:hypothetical protein
VWSTGLPDGFFSNQKSKFGFILEGLRLEMLMYFMAIGNTLQTFVIFYDSLVHFVFFCYIFSGFGIMYEDKSGNPGGQFCAHVIGTSLSGQFVSRFVVSKHWQAKKELFLSVKADKVARCCQP